MNPYRSAMRRKNAGRKWTCPPDKRRDNDALVFEAKNMPVVLLPSFWFETRGDHYMNHDVFEWLHRHDIGPWFPAYTTTFFYLGDRSSVGFFFENDHDAVAFGLYSGRLMTENYTAHVEREHGLKRLRHKIDLLSRDDRNREYPGLDEFLLSNFPVPAAK